MKEKEDDKDQKDKLKEVLNVNNYDKNIMDIKEKQKEIEYDLFLE